MIGKDSDPFKYNFVFTPDDTQKMMYENAIRPMVLELFSGCNATILAYGQTGSGKTHTLGTNFDGKQLRWNDEIGVLPRAVREIFEKIAAMPSDVVTVQCSFVKLCQETLYDLLSKKPREQSIVDRKIGVSNWTEKSVQTFDETMNCLMQGSSDRPVGATATNAQSNHSHTIFTLTVRKTPNDKAESATNAKFRLVDLAGSERSKTVAVGLKKGVKNDLFVLGNVLSALGSDKPYYIPYRESNLTRLLHSSLGGKSMVLVMACVSPAHDNRTDTIDSLNFAARATKTVTDSIVDEDLDGASNIRTMSWVNDEIDLFTALVDANQTYERMNKLRADHISDLEAAKQQRPQKPELIKQIEKAIEMLTTEISVLHDQINANDINTQMKTIVDSSQNLCESRSVMNMLVHHIAENRTNSNNYFIQARDYKQALEEQKVEMDEQLQQCKQKLVECEADNESLRVQLAAKCNDHVYIASV